MKGDDDCPPAGSRVSLRGIERMVSATDGVSTKLAHSMLVRGDTAKLLRFLPTAVLNTFNMHPRMRALQVRDQLFTAEIQAPVTSEDLAKLLQVRMLSPADYGDGTPSSWQAFVEKECSIGFDRYSQLPFYLTVWMAKRKDYVRFMLFSDQYMSDGFSGLVVLNCILEQVSILARAKQQLPTIPTVTELPLHPSLYRMWLKKITWAKPLLKGTNALFGRRIFRGNVHKFTPLLPARKDQHDFAIPPLTNSTMALFADGEPTCMQTALVRCKKEGVTLKGVLIVVVLLALYRLRNGKEQRGRFNPFRVMLDVDCNMRPHVQCPAHDYQVGLFTATTELNWLTSEGVDMMASRFWDVAGRATREIDTNLKNTLVMALPTITADQKLNAQMDISFLRNVRVAHSITSDVGVAEVIRYPFERYHALTPWSDTQSQSSFPSQEQSGQLISSSEEDKGELMTRPRSLESTASTSPDGLLIDSLHVYKALPHLAPSATIFLSAVNAFGYSIAHKVEPGVGKKLFTSLVLICESLGTIGRDETLMDVLARLDEDQG
uniref:Condensation domain-containing protein n=1 Tax=Hyaloperonospora arabidopsidis (strain Emoy2) TaxID=559515 RepID=M4BBD3_HYAAE